MSSPQFPPPTTIQTALSWAKKELQCSDSALLDSRVLLGHVLSCNSTYLHTWPEKSLTADEQKHFQQLVARRRTGEPIAYIVGQQEFWSLPIQVNSSTLIPRPETELIIETVLQIALPENSRCLDLGTGTGAIALALASEKPNWQIVGVDRVSEAVELAEHNKQKLQTPNVSFLLSDWFSNVPEQQYDLIVTNPPYVEESSKYLVQGDVRFEPKSALTSGDDGLDDIKLIVRHSQRFMTQGGYLIIEHGYQQAAAIRQILSNQGFRNVETRTDLAGLDRITLAQM